MANHPSAEKRARAAKRRAARNAQLKSKMRTAIKKVRAAKGKEAAQAELRKTARLLDQLAARGIIHRNKAANNKSALAKLVGKMK
jgi:small subunit ribosomal protein S20